MYLISLLTLISIINCEISDHRPPGENLLGGQEGDIDLLQLEVENKTIHVLQHEPFNISVVLKHLPHSRLDNVEVSWECNRKYLRPSNNSETVVMFSQQTNQRTFQLESSLYGIYRVRFYLKSNSTGKKEYFEDPEIEVWVERQDAAANKKMTYLFTSLVGFALILMGLELDMKIVLETVKRPVGPAIGMFCQFLLMPLFSYLLGWLLLSTTYERLGLLLLGCSPGGANSNFWTAMFDGDVNLSVTMTFISSVGSFAFTTMWVYLLGAPMVGRTVPIPYLQLTVSLALFVIPLLLGILIQYKLTKVAEKLKRVSRPFFFVCLIIFPVVGSIQNIHFFYMCDWQHVVSGAGLGFLGYIAGGLLAGLCKQGRKQIIAISLETAIQNGGIAFTVITLTFVSPISDMAVIPIIAFFFCATGPIVFVFYGVYFIFKLVQKRREFKPVSSDDKL